MDHGYGMRTPQGTNMLERVRAICRKLPEAEEIVDGFGHTVFQVNKKSFARLGEGDAGPALSFKSDRENQELLVQQEGFFRTPYIGQHGWVSIKDPRDWELLDQLLREAYLRAAPKRLVKSYRG